jgi:phosphatidylinositol-3-phosphatase
VRRLLASAAAAIALLAAGPSAADAALPPVKHVFVIVLENEDAAVTFGPGTKAPYLARTLTRQGQLMPNYYAVTHLSLGNYIAMVSGQGSNPETQSDCLFYRDVFPGTIGANGQATGQGCVYPRQVKTVADQLVDNGHGWKGYMEDMEKKPPATCRHPALNSQDGTQTAKANDQYAARHNPFVYFHSIIDSPLCARNDVPLTSLPGDLQRRDTTPSYVFITPSLCHDGHDEPCANGEPGGMVSADRFLQAWVPRIRRSAAYRAGGLLLVTFDEAENHDASACCNQPQFPNTPNNGGPTAGRGGGRIGAVALSPFVQAGSVNSTAYNHFSFLRSVEDLFGLRHLGFAAQGGLKAFGSDVFNGGPPSVRLGKIKPGRFRATASRKRKRRRRHPRGTRISYVLSQPATVSFRFQRARTGRRTRSGRCVRNKRSRRRLRRCRRWRRIKGGVQADGIAGPNSFRFNGRLNGRKLRPARYRLVAVPHGFAGTGSRATRRFRIFRR